MEERYQQQGPPSLGLLWNLHDGPNMHAVHRVQAEIASLLMHRNR